MNVSDQKKFFQNIALDENGNVTMVIESKNGVPEKGNSQFKTFHKLTLTEEGYLKTYNNI
tara:strand:+ start:805 stop:984 length:180 start_codon:yes stop_codon:yes gene_type:complete